MKLGATIPNVELGAAPEPIRDLAVGAEALGYDYLMLYDHVVSADMSVRPDWRPFNDQPPVYTNADPFHEPLVTYGYIAAITKTIGLATGVIILPQRQAVLVAKQAAEVDLLSRGRMRLGVGVGWNPLEYEALGMNFGDRGARMSEQIEVMRLLWTRDSVSFQGKWHQLDHVGMKHRPVQRPIPIWIGGTADPVLRRIAKHGDGWYVPSYMQEDEIVAHVARLHGYAREVGRDPSEIGIEGIIRMWGGRTPTQCAALLEMWQRIGATHVTFNTESESYRDRLGVSHVEAVENIQPRSIAERLDCLHEFKEAAARIV